MPERGGEMQPTVLLLHGIMAGPTVWDQARAILGNQVRWVAATLPGHGRSASPKATRYSLDAIADVLARVVERERPTHIVGHSMGAIAALALASRFPGRIQRVGAISIPVFQSRRAGVNYISRGRPWYRAALRHHGIAHLGCRTLGATWRLWLPLGPKLAPARPLRTLPAVFAHDARAHAGGLEEIVFAGHVQRLARDVPAPVVLLHADADPAAPIGPVRGLASERGWELQVVVGAGHQLPLTHPAVVAKWIADQVLG